MNRTSIVFAITTCTLCACGGLGPMSPLLGMSGGHAAENPLNGTPVQWSEKAPGVPFAGEKACSTWPIESSITLRATPEEICVDGTVYDVADSNFSREGKARLTVETDEGSAFVNTTNRKVGHCTDRNRALTVWSAEYKNTCMPNKDSVTGAAVLTQKSKELSAGEAKWRFPETTPSNAQNAATQTPAPAAAKNEPSPPPGARGGNTAGAAPANNDVQAKYKADVAKCMRGEAVDPASMVGGGTCKALAQAAKTGDDSKLSGGARDAFRDIRKK